MQVERELHGLQIQMEVGILAPYDWDVSVKAVDTEFGVIRKDYRELTERVRNQLESRGFRIEKICIDNPTQEVENIRFIIRR